MQLYWQVKHNDKIHAQKNWGNLAKGPTFQDASEGQIKCWICINQNLFCGCLELPILDIFMITTVITW